MNIFALRFQHWEYILIIFIAFWLEEHSEALALALDLREATAEDVADVESLLLLGTEDVASRV